MQQLFSLPRYCLIFLTTLVMVAACAGETAPPAGNPPSNANGGDDELQVVVFETQAPTDTPVPDPAATDTPAAQVGGGATSADANDSVVLVEESSGPTNIDFSRPADVNPLTGLKVDDPAVLQRRPLMVRVGNDPGARPQVGINQADIVYEEITEWWVTRFTAIYLSQDPDMIAPIRSARLINLQLGAQYQGALANSGGSDGVRWELSQSSLINLDEFFVPGPYFYRPNEGWQTRLAVDAGAARDYLAREGLDNVAGLRGFIFDEAPDYNSFPTTAIGDAQEVIVPYPQQTTRTTWTYDPASGRYQRSITGTPMFDFEGERVAASNVIVYFAAHDETDIVEDSNGATSIRINMNGRGAAWLFRDGKVLKGNWETDGTVTPSFIFDDDTPMPLKPGNTWIQVVPLAYEINIDGVDQNSLGPAANEQTTQDATDDNALDLGTAGADAPTPTLTPIGARLATPTAEGTD